MYFEQFYLTCLAHASYMLGSEGVAAVVDPQRDVDIYLEEAARQGLKIAYVIETHLHADFVSGHRELAERTGAAIYLGAQAEAAFPHVGAKEGDEIRLGQCVLRFLETPGHTMESMCVLVTDLERSPEPWAVLTGVTLIDGTGAPPVEDAVVVIQGERIYRVGRIGDFRYPDDATVKDLSNRYAIPGLMDLHAHARGGMMETFLAFGITTIRAPGARPGRGVELRDRLASGALRGPRMFSAGPLIDVPGGLFDEEAQVRTEAEVREEVRRQAATGVDHVKLYMGIPDSMLDAAVRAAHERHIKVLGHLKRTSWSTAAEMGIDGLVHSCSEGPTWELIPAEQARFPWNEWGTSLRAWASAADRLDLSGAEMQRLVEALLRDEVEVNPTLVTMEALYWADDSEHLEQQAPGFVPPGFTERWSANWKNNRNFMAQWGLNPSEWSQLKQSFVACQQMVRHLHDRGVLLTAGSDVGSWMTPGVSLHRDLELLGEAGISPMDVLQIGTSNGAKALGISEEVGTLEAGRLADIVILRDDPLADIRNTLSIELVIHRGMVLNPAELLAKAQTRQ